MACQEAWNVGTTDRIKLGKDILKTATSNYIISMYSEVQNILPLNVVSSQVGLD